MINITQDSYQEVVKTVAFKGSTRSSQCTHTKRDLAPLHIVLTTQKEKLKRYFRIIIMRIDCVPKP